MLVSAKAILSNFAIARAQSNKFPVHLRTRQKSNSIVWALARAVAKLLKITQAATNIALTPYTLLLGAFSEIDKEVALWSIIPYMVLFVPKLDHNETCLSISEKTYVTVEENIVLIIW